MSVYFAWKDGLVKIGYSGAPRLRAAQLGQLGARAAQLGQLGARLVAVMPGNFATENSIHHAFKDDRVHGEWFAPSDRVKTLIDVIRRVHPLEIPGRRNAGARPVARSAESTTVSEVAS